MSDVIPNIGNEIAQKMTVIRDNGKEFELLLYYRPQAIGWFMSITSEGRTIRNIRIVVSANILHQYRNLLGFGIACETDDGFEPHFKDDFSSGRAQLLLLTQDEVEAFTEVVSGQVST